MAFPRFRRGPSVPADGAALRRPVATPGQLRRERRALVRAREERIRDLGGLMLEMYRRDRFRDDLVQEQCGELLSLEARISDLDAMLSASSFASRRAASGRCLCGAPLVWGSHFCANCGRPTGDAIVACARCEHPLPADAEFCARCGAPATDPELPASEAATPEEAYEEAAVEAEAEAVAASEDTPLPANKPADPWEE